jgi:hypothetical protein
MARAKNNFKPMRSKRAGKKTALRIKKNLIVLKKLFG